MFFLEKSNMFLTYDTSFIFVKNATLKQFYKLLKILKSSI